jgi:hypothetical protein
MKFGRREQIVQRAIFDHLRARAVPGCFYFHCPNGGYRYPAEAAILKGLGVRSGVPDVLVLHQGRLHGIELKVSGGHVTPAQTQALAELEAAGAVTAIAWDLDAALLMLEGWGILRGRVTAGMAAKEKTHGTAGEEPSSRYTEEGHP